MEKNIICEGSYCLGTGCKKCERCAWEALKLINHNHYKKCKEVDHFNEDVLAEMEAKEIDTSDNYFGARNTKHDNSNNRKIFRAGFERGYKKAL